MRKAKVKNDGSREFRPSSWMRFGSLVFAGYVLFVAVANVFIERPKVPWYILLCAVLFFGFLSWRLLMWAEQMSLTVNSDGLEYRFGSGRVITSWDNLLRFAHRGGCLGAADGIELRNSVRRQVHGSKMEKAFFGEKPVDFVPLSEIVPMPRMYDKKTMRWHVDIGKLAKTPFGQELLHHAPHLFEE